MSKEFLLRSLENIQQGEYRWQLYFMKIDRRNTNPYYVYKHTFRQVNYLPDYINALRSSMQSHQIEPLDTVQNYDGYNSKTSCDKLETTNELINEQWNYLAASLCGAQRENISGKYQGYILDGQPAKQGFPAITIVKTGNPLLSLERKDTRVFKYTEDHELSNITDNLCRLYLVADFLVIGNVLYAFNHKFEGVFNLEKTLHRLKMKAVDDILSAGAFADVSAARDYMERYTSPRTFLSLKAERARKLNSEDGRHSIADLLGIPFSNGKIVLEDQVQANNLIKYLCNKIFQDKETDNLLEVASIVNENVLGS